MNLSNPTLIEESKKLANSPRVITQIDLPGSGLTDVTSEVLAVDGYKEIANDKGSLTKDSITLSVSNLNGDKFNDPANKYSSSSLLDQEVLIATGFLTGTSNYYNRQKGVIRNINNNDKLKSSNLTILTNPEVNKKITYSGIFVNQTPGQLIERIIGQLGSTLSTFSLTPGDETGILIDKISYFDDNAFVELNDLVEYSGGQLIYDTFEDKYKYYTNAYLIDKMEDTVNEDIKIDSTRELIGNPVLLESENRLDSESIENNLELTYGMFDYITESTTDAYTVTATLAPGETITIRQPFNGFDLYENITIGSIQALVIDDKTLDYAIIDGGSHISYNYTAYAKGIDLTLENIDSGHVLKFFVNVVGNKYEWRESTLSKQDQSATVLRPIKKFSRNKYFQNAGYATQFLDSYLESHKEPDTFVRVKTTGLPQLELLDKVKVVNRTNSSNFQEFVGLVKRIQWSFDKMNGFFMWIELFKAKKVDQIREVVDINFDDASNIESTLNTEIDGGELKLTSTGGYTDIRTYDITFDRGSQVTNNNTIILDGKLRNSLT